MDQARKRPLPPLPQKIGLVTSPNGAAVHDVLRTLRRRYPLAQVQLAGVQVEGPQAPQAMMMAMKTVVDAGCELVLLVRGGGSFEDLMPFNDEKLAITISRCPVPVVTGIGHEPDTSIADMVADLRCSTPTAAAEAVSADVGQLRSSLDGFGDSMQGALRRLVDVGRLKLERLESRPVFTDSHALLGGAAQTLDLQQERLRKALPRNIERDASGLENARRRLGSAGASLVAPSASSFSFAQQSLLARGRVFSECFDAQWRGRARCAAHRRLRSSAAATRSPAPRRARSCAAWSRLRAAPTCRSSLPKARSTAKCRAARRPRIRAIRNHLNR